jgi:hypothetical protein
VREHTPQHDWSAMGIIMIIFLILIVTITIKVRDVEGCFCYSD